MLIIGAPKAGTTALHAALARHPQIYASPVKEPKYYLCADAPPPAYCGPGDAHSQQEWVWRRADYAALFAAAPADAVRLESTPFYLYLADARRRIAEELPEARLIAVVRDPIDRAYSNWMHLWVDGLEPIGDFVAAWHAEDERVAAGWAPFWHYRRLGRYGEQLRRPVRPGRPGAGAGAALLAAGLRAGRDAEPGLPLPRHRARTRSAQVPPDNSRPFVGPGLRTAVLGRAIRAGAAAGPAAAARRSGGRRARPLVAALQSRRTASSGRAGSGAAGGAARRLPGRHRAARGGARGVLPGLALDHRPRLVRGSHRASATPLHVAIYGGDA